MRGKLRNGWTKERKSKKNLCLDSSYIVYSTDSESIYSAVSAGDFSWNLFMYYYVLPVFPEKKER